MVFGIKKDKMNNKYYALNENDLYVIGKKEGLSDAECLKYVMFMRKRFPQESHASYAQEWAQRFKNGHPETYMDSESKKAYSEVSDN